MLICSLISSFFANFAGIFIFINLYYKQACSYDSLDAIISTMNLKKINLLLITFSVLACLIAGEFVFAESGGNTEEINKINQEISDRKAKIKKMEDAIEGYKKSISQKQTQAVSLKNQLAILDNRSAQIEVDVELTETKINKTELEIGALQLSIDDKEITMGKQKTIISQIIQNLHIQDQKNYLEILLGNDDFAEFYSQVKHLEDIYTDLGRSVKNLRTAKEELDIKKEDVEERKESYEKLKLDLENKKQDLEEQSEYKSVVLGQTRSSELKYQTLLKNLRAQYQQIESEIRSYEEQVRKRLEAEGSNLDIDDSSSFLWPVPSKYITAYFHDKSYPYKHVFEHNAIDLRAGQGTPIKAAKSGYVARAKHCSYASCYSYILIVHTSGLSTGYGHISKILVSADQYVHQGDIIGYSGGAPGTVGAGPFTTGPHLHFEIRKNGIPVNPLNYLD